MELSAQEKQKLAMMLKKEQNCSLRKATQLLEEAGWDYKKASKPKSVDLFCVAQSQPIIKDNDVKSKSTKERKLASTKEKKSTSAEENPKRTSTKSDSSKKSKTKNIEEKEEPISRASQDTPDENKSLNLKTIKERIEATSGGPAGYNLEEYNLRCQFYCKHPKYKPAPPSCINTGYTPMQEIVAYASTIKQVVSESSEEKMLEKFNKTHKTNFETWLEISRDYQSFTEEDLLEYKDQIKWYEWNKTHEEPQLSKKAAKALREKFLIRITMQ